MELKIQKTRYKQLEGQSKIMKKGRREKEERRRAYGVRGTKKKNHNLASRTASSLFRGKNEGPNSSVMRRLRAVHQEESRKKRQN